MQRSGLLISIRQHGIPPGASLVEVVVAMGIASILMGLSITTLQTVMRAERASSKAVWLGASFQRFSRQFRADIHAATDLKLEKPADQESTELIIQKPDGQQVKYQIQEFRINRMVSQDQQRIHQDTYYLPEGSQAHFIRQQRLNQAGITILEPALVSSTSGRDVKNEDKQAALSNEFSIRSSVGHDYRLSEISFRQPEKETNETK